MPASISATYDAATHTVTVTVAGGPSGTLKVFHDFTPAPDRIVMLVAEAAYSGGPVTATWRFARHGVNRFYAYIDDVQQDYVDLTVTLDTFWLRSLSDPTRDREVCLIVDRQDSWRSRERRGWYGDVVGTTRTVGVTDVAMSGRRGRLSLLARTATEHRQLDWLLRQGVVCFRGAPPRDGGYWLIERYTDSPLGSSEAPSWRYDIDWVLTWPVGLKERLPDEPEP